MKTKKIPYYLFLASLTFGASLIIGFLSFGGILAIWPILGVAFLALGLSVAYEGEVYWQNIHGALTKLLKRDYLKQHLAGEYLQTHFPKNTQDEACPKFFGDYEKLLHDLAQFDHAELKPEQKRQQKKIKKMLRDMDKWFAIQLFHNNDEDDDATPYEKELREWLANNGQQGMMTLFTRRRKIFWAVSGFSVLAGVFMGMSTTYLLVGEFAAIPLLASIPFGLLPAIILPLAVIAGAAYGLLIYNSVTDMINNDTLRKWYLKIRDDFRQGKILRNVLMLTMVILLVSLAIALTVCTAGTWWTIAKNTQPLFSWMTKIPDWVMGIINPLIIGSSSLTFDLENSAESLDLIDKAIDRGTISLTARFYGLINGFSELKTRENWIQMLNPFRLLLKLIIAPLRIILFFVHLCSMSANADRVPGVPDILSFFLGLISEGFVDWPYFLGHSEAEHNHDHDHHDTQALINERFNKHHGHDHSNDIPTILLKALFSPIYFLAAGWDYLGSNILAHPCKPLDFTQAWHKQMGQPLHAPMEESPKLEMPSEDCLAQLAIHKIERYKSKHFQMTIADKGLAKQKMTALSALQQRLRDPESDQKPSDLIKEQAGNEVYDRHRFFSKGHTSTREFLEELQNSISAA